MWNLYLLFLLYFGGWSVEGVRTGSPWTSPLVVRGPVRSGGPRTGGQCFRVTLTFTFTFTTIQARPLYEAYVLGSVSVLTRCYCSVFNVHTPVLKALRLGAVAREAGKAFHCSRVLGRKLYLRYVFLSRGTRNELECIFLKCLLCGLSSLTISTSIRLFTIL